MIKGVKRLNVNLKGHNLISASRYADKKLMHAIKKKR